MTESKTHEGSCRCGAVAYEVETELDGLIECNCSHCYRKGLVLAFVSPDAFRVTADGPQTEYRFNTHKITHLFCETCGVQSFARGTAPDGRPMVAINIRTLTDIEPFSWTAQQVDGRSF
ncbi:MAG: GFA family protein, partial [Alphaproteobacteria bacterium]|uniref:GFA family protein n=1 Tax=Brevundimonas sp. TaxID=1871086 RepID=UPI0017FD0AD1|nr:GFA family protein [Brevundimonas sp.]MBA3050965.1 GFA family protein [Brevundimonas sp.]MBU3975315.1 GFA family protein [Alphaproteobacteria bacterium]MBU4135010.1 GFA family protein [Alphaproteobacteria bacterium]